MNYPPNYPGHGEPCNGCGVCCLAEPCALSRDLFGDVAQCPALEQHHHKYSCGLIANPGQYGAIPQDYLDAQAALPQFDAEAAARGYYAAMLGAGRWCDSEL
jgi:hypothetical protein